MAEAVKTPVPVAVIGVGYLGKFHAEKYSRSPRAELRAVIDIDEARARQVAAECGARALTDYREILGEVKAVSIAVPTAAHHRVAADCLRRGIDILVEKFAGRRCNEPAAGRAGS